MITIGVSEDMYDRILNLALGLTKCIDQIPEQKIFRKWVPEEDEILKNASSPAAAYKAYCERYPYIHRSKGSVKSRWYRVRRAIVDSQRLPGQFPLANLAFSSDPKIPYPDFVFYLGEQVRVRKGYEYAGRTGTVKRVRLTTNEALIAIDEVPDLIWLPTHALCIETGNKFQPGDLIATGPGAPTGRDLGVWKVMDYNSEYDKYYIVGVAEIGNGRYLVFEDINMWLEREYAEEWFEKIGVLSPIFEEN